MDNRDKQITLLQNQVKELRQAIIMLERHIKLGEKKTTQLRIESQRVKHEVLSIRSILKE